ncbi:C10 family peptidase [uncultured Duncaniella sp.]|uniref:C10 family peptidase n=1 Tax=uncultured Duncaniella sp. TaxID=2768039 RepID=UPI0025B631A6|nr:C10 family peptidase [uncultured Duncaniella sp.]
MKQVLVISMFLIALIMSGCSVEEPVAESGKQPAQTDPNYVSLNEALNAAESYFSGIYGSKTRSSRKISNVEVYNLRKTRGSLDEYGYYVVNYEDDGGFALLSADRRRNAVYAISDEGSISLSDTLYNEGLSWYLNEFLPKQGASDRLIVMPDTTKMIPITGDKYFYYTTCAPLLNGFMRKFNQTSPYNKYCFTKDGQKAMVGCLPVAVGTFIGYNKWPNQLAGYNFNWDEMYGNSTHDSWYRLLEIVGRSEYLNAQYGIYATYAYMHTAKNMLAKIGYENVRYRTFNEDDAFNELKNSRLLILYGERSTGAHAWVVDGSSRRATELALPSIEAGHPVYRYEDFYHCVWGWGGQSNGYFLYNNKLGGVAHEYDPDTNAAGHVYENLKILSGEKK